MTFTGQARQPAGSATAGVEGRLRLCQPHSRQFNNAPAEWRLPSVTS
ncbi:hypothetical protein PJI17_13445 [Mycobacterium kansasii]